MLVALVMAVGACGAEEPMPTCEPRDVNAFGLAPPWEDLARATCGELLTIEQQNERCADGGEYFVARCIYYTGPDPENAFAATCGAEGEAECNGLPFGVDGTDLSPTCVDICPYIR